MYTIGNNRNTIMDNNKSTFEKTFDKISNYSLGNVALMISLWGAREVVNKIASPDSLASVAVNTLSEAITTVVIGTGAIMLAGAAIAITAGSAYMLVKASLKVKELAQDMHKDHTKQKAADATQLNTDIQNELKELSRQTNGDPRKTLDISKLRLSVAILDGDDHKKAIYTEVNKRLTAEPEDLAPSIASTDFAMR
jgi:hypothetical protein